MARTRRTAARERYAAESVFVLLVLRNIEILNAMAIIAYEV